MLIGECAQTHVRPKIEEPDEEGQGPEQIPAKNIQRSRAEQLARFFHQVERGPLLAAPFHSSEIFSQTLPSCTEAGNRISPWPTRSKNHHARKRPSRPTTARRIRPKRELPVAWTRSPAARQLAQRTRPSCSETHSRQKKRRHSGHRAAASRSGWWTQRCARETFILLSRVPLVLARRAWQKSQAGRAPRKARRRSRAWYRSPACSRARSGASASSAGPAERPSWSMTWYT